MLRNLALWLVALGLLAANGTAFAQVDDGDEPDEEEPEFEEPYIDDRSTPEAVITSYYNAINRAEYARAYSYYGEDEAPSNYNRWETGYSDTMFVEVRYGDVTEEGAAGSVYYHVPVKLDVETTEAQHRYFSGCYVIRLANPAIQGLPYVPMHIDDASLRRSTRRASPPASCN